MDISGGRKARKRAAQRVPRGAFLRACAERAAPGRAMTLYEAVRVDIGGLPVTSDVRINLENTTQFKRQGRFAERFAARYGLDDDDMDALFERAAEIEAEG